MDNFTKITRDFLESNGFEVALISVAFSIIKAMSNVISIIRFSEDKTAWRIIGEVFLEVPTAIISFVIAVFVGYLLLSYLSDNDLPSYIAYGWTGLSGIIGSNIVNSLVKLNFDSLQKKVDKGINGD